MGAKKAERFPDEEFLDEAIRTKRATEQLVGMRGIVADFERFQARVLHLDMDHVKYLAAQLRQAGRLTPIVVFKNQKTHQHVIADGFHRHEAYRKEGEKQIHAYVIEGDESDVLYYATMCNRRRGLGRTEQDKERAVKMLLDTAAWFNRSDTYIASHVGIACSSTIAKYRIAYCKEKAKPLPDRVETPNGKVFPYARARTQPNKGGLRSSHNKRQNPSWWVSVKGRQVYLGRDKAAAEAAYARIQQEREDARLKAANSSSLAGILAVRGIHSRPTSIGSALSGYSGIHTDSHVIVTMSEITQAAADRAIAGAILLRRNLGARFTPVIVWHELGFSDEVLSVARSEGILFLTPDELVERIKSDKSENHPGSDLNP